MITKTFIKPEKLILKGKTFVLLSEKEWEEIYEDYLTAHSPYLLKEIDRARQELKDGKVIDFKKYHDQRTNKR